MERGTTSDPKRTTGFESFDYISNMPDPILHRILSLLETHEAVQTCILSKRWTTLWTSLSSLSFNVLHFYRGEPFHEELGSKWYDPMDYWSEQEREKYWSQFRMKENDQAVFSQFVSMVLHRREPYDLDKFHLKCRDAVSCSTDEFVKEWIQYALTHNVHELHFSTRSIDCFPTCIFDCSSLEKLYLEIHPDHHLYRSEGDEVINLPNLKELYLIGVILDANLSRLFLGCPALEDLCLEECPFENFQMSSNMLKHLTIIFSDYEKFDFIEIEDFVLRICAPNLTSLSFIGQPVVFRNIIFESTFSLIQLHLEFDRVRYTDKRQQWLMSSSYGGENPWEQFLVIPSIKDLEISVKPLPPVIAYSVVSPTGHICLMPLHNGGGSSTRLRTINDASSSNISPSPDRDLCDTLRSVFGSSSDSSSSDDEAANESSKSSSPINCKNLSEIKVKYFSEDGSVKKLLDSFFNISMELTNIKIVSSPY
ncbi:hypothetical protein LUZ61_009034 [Rhynchospora tenuis]|uniref:F-box domain-containing protein n=1 Tax=Rhynchospora tenuis TaxID=198213 RepID=A0AAD5ZWS5_9POAL|nr:hypothetical protein LUZ61_009034 [Rhynchospora tenuis]